MVKPLKFTRHAMTSVAQREIALAWIEKTVFYPDWVVPDVDDPTLERRFAVISGFGGRTLRVVCFENNEEVRIITVFFDRKARRP